MKAVEERKEKDFMRTDDINYVTIYFGDHYCTRCPGLKVKFTNPEGVFYSCAQLCVVGK